MKRRSQHRAMGTAIPAIGPLMAAMIGFDVASRYVYSPAKSTGWSGSGSTASAPGPASSSGPPSVSAVRLPRSAPAQNARPAPVMTIPTTAGSASARSTAWRTSAAIRWVQAFSCAGRSRVMVATGSSTT